MIIEMNLQSVHQTNLFEQAELIGYLNSETLSIFDNAIDFF
jgi:hypothetical protein